MEGIEVFGVRLLGPQDRGINKHIAIATWVVGIPYSELNAFGVDETTLRARINERRKSSLRLKRVRKGVEKEIDISASLLNVHVGQGSETLKRAGLLVDFFPIRFDCRLLSTGNAKPSEVAHALLGEEMNTRIVREELWALRDGKKTSLLEIEDLRPSPTSLRAAK